MQNNRPKYLFLSVVCAAIVVSICWFFYNYSDYPFIKRLAQVFGGAMPSGIIQFLTFILFFWGMFETYARLSRIKYERQSFSLNLLPEKEQWVLSPDDVNELKLKMIAYEKENKFLMTDILKKASTKFRSNKSISDVMQIVTTQIKINAQKAEGGQSVIRYLVWAIPSMGFIGTILGIAESLGMADQASDPAILKDITNSMYVAFDTTLVALILSIVLMWYYYKLQENEEQLHTDMEEYILENFVNRIHVE
ncbi:MAG: MotA/TolQ/ExbB proton channel family protein [Chitinophagales bacterium]|nr:MotA/TolQ/ExbB proton channel family protein [Bacteroidota bacterium]MCB9044081.1 MotA/TolQ/ExbB proton channel family protein [Chitinophagales bacterium]